MRVDELIQLLTLMPQGATVYVTGRPPCPEMVQTTVFESEQDAYIKRNYRRLDEPWLERPLSDVKQPVVTTVVRL